MQNAVNRKPDWLKVRAPGQGQYGLVKQIVRAKRLHTVCEAALCPNVSECWGEGTATFMLLGDVCTRACRFCHVKSGNPRGLVNNTEPQEVAEAVQSMGLSYVVLTSVDRDDLDDGGAGYFVKTVQSIKALCPTVTVELLVPDFLGDKMAIEIIASCGAQVIGHNLETVRRLTPTVRDKRSNYDLSLYVLEELKKKSFAVVTKSSLMLGLGETKEEIAQTMRDLRNVGVAILTLGQYLRPSNWHLPVEQYIHPTVFEDYRKLGLQMGFSAVAAGPLVRSSYLAGERWKTFGEKGYGINRSS